LPTAQGPSTRSPRLVADLVVALRRVATDGRSSAVKHRVEAVGVLDNRPEPGAYGTLLPGPLPCHASERRRAGRLSSLPERSSGPPSSSGKRRLGHLCLIRLVLPEVEATNLRQTDPRFTPGAVGGDGPDLGGHGGFVED
jgi:hypothetical protein